MNKSAKTTENIPFNMTMASNAPWVLSIPNGRRPNGYVKRCFVPLNISMVLTASL